MNDADVEVTPDTENDPDKTINFSKLHHALGDRVLSENNGSQNKNIGDNGGESATCSEFSEKRLKDEFAGILSFN